MICIYKITNPINQIYVGQTINEQERWRHYKKGYCFTQRKLFNSLIYYGTSNHTFEIIEECDKEDLNDKEKYWQIFYNSCGNNGLNSRVITSIKSPNPAVNIRNRSRKLDKSIRYEKFIRSIEVCPVYDCETGIFFDTISEAAESININRSTLSHYLNGYRKNTTNIRFSYKENPGYVAITRKGPRKGMPAGIQKPGLHNMSNKAVQAINTETNQIIHDFFSIAEAGRNGYSCSSISGVLKGTCKTHKGLFWRYK